MGTRIRSGFSVAVIVLACVTLCGIDSVCGASKEPRSVQVSVRAKWSGTSVLLEAGELLSKEWKDRFWDFVEVWLHNEQDASDSHSAKDCIKKILKHGRSLLTEPLASVFELSLLLRSASPRLVLYQQLAEESLSSFTVHDESNSKDVNRNLETERSDSLLVGVNRMSPGGSCCWVDTGRDLFFDVADLQTWLRNPTPPAGDAFKHPELFDFDHIYFDSSPGIPVAILYGALGTECFRDFHVTLIEAAKKEGVKYVVRSVLPSGCEALVGLCGTVGTNDTVNLGGYGVELALKNMEYKAMDDSKILKGVTLEDPRTEDLSQEVRGFIFSKILDRKPELTSEVMAFRDHLLSSTVSDTLDIWELKDLGHQTVQRIVQSSDPLQSMQEITQNFPSVVSSLSRMKLNVSVKEEILANQKMIHPGKSIMALNGGLVNIEDIDLHQVVDLVHQELSLADQLSKLKVPGSAVRRLLSTTPLAEAGTYRLDFRSTHVHYLNNLEEDAMYRRWGTDLNQILMPARSGKPNNVRKNLLHAVFVLDPATICGLESVDMIRSLYEKKFFLRFGIILYSSKLIKELERNGGELDSSSVENDSHNEDMSTLIIRLFIYVKENHGIRKAFRFLSNVNKRRTETQGSNEDAIEIECIEGAFVETILSKATSPPRDILLELKKEQTYKDQSHDSSIFVLKLGLANLQCCLLMNGLIFESSQEALLSAMSEEFPRIQEQVYYGQIDLHTDVLDRFLSQNGIRRYNPKIMGNEKVKPRSVSLSNSFLEGNSVLNDINYLHSPETIDDVKPVTHILVIDITSKRGMRLLREGIRYLIGGCKGSRLGVLFGANQDTDVPSCLFVKVFDITAHSYSHKKSVLHFLDKLCAFYEKNYLLAPASPTVDAQGFMDMVSELAGANGLSSKAYKTAFSELSLEKIRKHMKKVTQFLYGLLGPECGLDTVITNGRVTYPNDETIFLSHDLHLLGSVEFKQRVNPIMEIIEHVNWENVDPDMLTSKFISDVIMCASSAIATRDRSSETARFELLNAKYSAIVRDDKNSGVHIDAVVDPLSSSGQKFASILRVLGKCIQPSLRIVLNPLSSLVDLPLKSYYRYVVPTVDDFSSTDYTVNGPKSFFANMPLSKTLTMNLDVPEPWLVEPVNAIHDLDNILLENLGDTRTLQAVFELEALVLTGHCSEKDSDPPRGLQLILGTKVKPHMVDTIVMANLGYWQMKVSPGVWYLQLAPGRSSELYTLDEDGDNSQLNPMSKRITINDLRGKVVRLEAVKKKGKEQEALLVTDDEKSQEKKGNNFLQWASGLIVGNDPSQQDERPSQDHKREGRHGRTINIFSIASGHLYERFLKIMILSVLKNTHRPVKFWFIKNYLSPSFKDVIPHMAQEYGFEYELVTYKWPSWLHKQKEKQRIIWAYKILFLDVIFPISLEKVIFVDADQIVRADMGELYDMDIKGRPLAYTPFCDNNKDMDGYRFWRQGFWKEHLRGRPYHISALYVVDLKKFRVTAAGDNLRVVYETLSKDPNSLANLDQDLPNYAQHGVPIFSLPQEWLWCESWCGNATKSKAKTIDLCNNPMTKEPKLQGAKRIVPEWIDLDLEARRFTARISGEEVEEEPSSSESSSSDKTIRATVSES